MVSIGCLILALLTVIVVPNIGTLIADGMQRLITRLRKLPVPAGWLLSATSVLGCAATTTFLFWPVPSVHDEFAYVLTADTFLEGRLTNPEHPFAEHFESWHILQSPSYQAKYPPAQGLALAIGDWLGGKKLFGVWMTLAIALLATGWACNAWLPQRWAILATFLLACNVPMSFAWGNSYWGGAVAMLGGSLLVGSLGYSLNRLRPEHARSPLCSGNPSELVQNKGVKSLTADARPTMNWRHAFALGSGLGILAASRPFEGALMALPLGLFALTASWKLKRAQWLKFWLGAATATTVSMVPLLIYNQAVTSVALKMPYQIWTEQQGDALNRLLTPAMALLDHEANAISAEQRDWRAVELARWLEVRSAHRLAFVWHKLLQTYAFYFQGVLLIPLLALPWAIHRQRNLLWLVAAVVMVTLGSCTHLSAGHAHYVAGLTSALMILAMAGLRHLHISLPTIGRPLVGGVLLAWGVAGTFAVGEEVVQRYHPRAHAWAKRQANLVEKLTTDDLSSLAKQIVFVRYTPEHNVHQEWVYNAADIDAAPLVWANDLGDAANSQLVEYYWHRGVRSQCWLLNVDRGGEHLQAYHPAAPTPPNSSSTTAPQLIRSTVPAAPTDRPTTGDQVH